VRKLDIDEMLFRQAFDRDTDFHDAFPRSPYLNMETGEILWAYEDDEDAYMDVGVSPLENQAIRKLIAASPDRYLEIPGLAHGDHHDILQEFLDSDWTEDKETKSIARNAYFGSIGGWKKSLEDDSILHAFYDFRDLRTKQMAEEFLRRQGIDPHWI
jgi:hypothetical protein